MGCLFLANYPRLDLDKFLHEILHVNNKIFDYGEVGHGLDGYCSTLEVVEKAGACQLWLSIDVCAAAAAYSHSARPSVGQASVELGFDIVQSVEDDHVLPVRDLVLLEVGLRVFLRPVPGDSYRGYVLAHLASRHAPLVSSVLS